MRRILLILGIFGFLIFASQAFAEKKVALTFDDGPWPKYTREILDILDKYQIRATFFVIGEHAQRYPEILKEVARRGHVLGNHTWSHPNLTKITDHEIREEILKTEKLVDSLAPGALKKFLRPPCFYIDRRSALAVSRCGYWLVFATIDPRDWDAINPEMIVEGVLTRAKRDVEIIVLHDGGGSLVSTVKALPKIIEGLKEKGYEFVTISDLGK